MFYIKLDEDMKLVITAAEPIYRGDNLNRRIIYLLPLTVGEIDVETAYVYLNYIRADGAPDVVRLKRLEEKYNESYFQYVFPVVCRLTQIPGEVCTWLQIYTGDVSNPTVAKSSECVLRIESSKNMDDYLGDRNITALYQLEKSFADKFDNKADCLFYDADSRRLSLKSGENELGEAVIVPSDDYTSKIAELVEDTWYDMDEDITISDDDVWDPM